MPSPTSPRPVVLARVGAALALGIIGAATLIPTPGSVVTGGFACLTCGAWLQDGLDNVLLFAPLGLALTAAGLGRGRPTVVALLVSIVIEALQVSVIEGRDAALADLIANALGGALGEATWRLRLWWPGPRTAAWAAMIGGGCLAAMAGSPGRWFVPIGPPGPYYPHLDPRTAPFPADATLDQATWNGRAIQCCPDSSSASMRDDVAGGHVVVDVAGTLGAPPARRGRLLTVWDARSTPVVAIGITPARVWGSLATPARGDGVRDFAVGVAPVRPWAAGDTVRVQMESRRGTWRLVLRHAGVERLAVVRQRPLLAAYYFLPGFRDVTEPHPVTRWLAFLLPAVLLGWTLAFTPWRAKWLGGPAVAIAAVAWGGPWMHPALVAVDLVALSSTAAVATALRLAWRRRVETT